MYVGTMHGYCLDLCSGLCPRLQVLGSDRDHRAHAHRPEQQEVGTDRLPDASAARVPVLRRYLHSKLYLQVTSVLREDDVD